MDTDTEPQTHVTLWALEVLKSEYSPKVTPGANGLLACGIGAINAECGVTLTTNRARAWLRGEEHHAPTCPVCRLLVDQALEMRRYFGFSVPVYTPPDRVLW